MDTKLQIKQTFCVRVSQLQTVASAARAARAHSVQENKQGKSIGTIETEPPTFCVRVSQMRTVASAVPAPRIKPSGCSAAQV